LLVSSRHLYWPRFEAPTSSPRMFLTVTLMVVGAVDVAKPEA
jgi:hypothetical protein